MLDSQLAWLQKEQSHGIYLGTLSIPGKLLYPMLSLPNVVTPKPLEPYDYAAYFSKVVISLV